MSPAERDSTARLSQVLLVAVLVAATAATPAAAATTAATPAAVSPATTHPSEGPSFVVDLADDGDARITLTMTFDLETDDERDAFRTLQNDSDARADARERFRSRMAAVASDASNATGRDMGVTDAAIDLSTATDGHVGIVQLSVTWSNLAAVEDGRLVVTEPFASGFEPDRPFTLRGPDGYERADASPAPDARGPNAATWEAGSDLSGFEATFAPAGSDGGDASAGSDGGAGGAAPGFGASAALFAVAAAALALARRR